MSVSIRALQDQVMVRVMGVIDYRRALDEQRRVVATLMEDQAACDQLLLLEHPAVYTAGRRTEPHERPSTVTGIEVIDVDRGGKITWHGPGQLVGYPIVRLGDSLDTHDYVRRIEQALIAVCDRYGLHTGRVEGRSGVWLAANKTRPQRKIAAIGIRVTHGIAMHGFALNVDPDLSAFADIIPCGITDAGVTSLSAELGRGISIGDVIEDVEIAVLGALDGALPVTTRDLAVQPLSAAHG